MLLHGRCDRRRLFRKVFLFRVREPVGIYGVSRLDPLLGRLAQDVLHALESD
jgi:hypothetical protein